MFIVFCFCFQGVNIFGGCKYSEFYNKLPDLHGKGEPNRFSGHRTRSFGRDTNGRIDR